MFVAIVLLVLGYAAVCTLLYFQQEALLFHPTKLGPEYRYGFGGDFVEIDIQADGAVINAVHFKVDRAQAAEPKGVILYLHGNGDIIPRLGGIATYYIGLGYDVLMPDYRGYGKSTGTITNEADLHADMALVYAYLLREYEEDQIVVYGQSIGTGLATRLAAEHSPRLLILESPYYSMVSLVQARFPFIPGFLVKYQLRSDRRINDVTCPVYVIHGTEDRVIPIDQGTQLYDLFQGKKELLLLPGAGHGPLLGDERLRTFLERVLF